MAENKTPNNGSNGNGNGSLVKAGTNVASKAISALSGTPVLLVLVLLNVGMFAMMTYLIIKSAEYRYAERQEMIKMLTNCIEENLRKNRVEFQTPGWDKGGQQKANR
jgi:hypothetical protein